MPIYAVELYTPTSKLYMCAGSLGPVVNILAIFSNANILKIIRE